MKRVVIYARYSSFKQNEMSIEGQLKACQEYALQHNYEIIETYIDRALTARSDKRPQFQKMISDSSNQEFMGVLVFQLDRFSRNRYDSAIYKKKLEENGVKVFSVKEEISEGSSGIITESMIEAFAEYFSVQLSEKVSRGMYLNAEKCKYNGGALTLGFKIDADKNYCIDPVLAPIMHEVFERYASGQTMAEITNWLNEIGIRTARNNAFSKNSLQHILRNEKYIGVYSFGDIKIYDGIPRIISDELFYKVQARLLTDQRKGGKYKAEEEYILTGKLYCGKCKNKMVGISGKSGGGNIYRYYSCHTGKDGDPNCTKKNVSKDYIEDKVASDCFSLLTDELIDIIAERTIAISDDAQIKAEISRMKKLVKEKESAIETLLDSLETGVHIDRISKRINERESEINNLKKQILTEKKKLISLTKEEVPYFLDSLRKGNINTPKYKKLFINSLIDKIYLYDDEYEVYFNISKNNSVFADKRTLPPSLGSVRISSETVYQIKRIGWPIRFYFLCKL